MVWVRLASTGDLEEGSVLGIKAEDQHVALFCRGGQYYATSNICTHQFALLSDGYFEDCYIECPLHQGRFDIRTGEAICAPVTENIKVFPVKIEGDNIMVEV